MLPKRISRPPNLLGVALALGILHLGACGPRQDTDASEGAESTGAAAPADALSCIILDGTLEEAAERLSPLGQTEISLGDHKGKLCYGRPSARERVVMGELVPFGAPWRLGADEATALHLGFAANVGGIQLEPGSYSLYAIPGEAEWEIVVNGKAARWGIPIDEEVTGSDLGSFSVPVGSTRSMVEQLTVGWHSHGNVEGHLVVDWERTRIEIPVAVSGG
jgi:hypothetical protein